jgi:hypothetical protein
LGRGWLIFVLAGCGETPHGGTSRDGGVDTGDAGDDPAAPAPPEAAETPRTTPCPPGWRAVADDAEAFVAWCDPWPAAGPADCGADEAHFPGGAGCERVGPACPAGPFAEDLPATDVVYVDPSAPPGGDGSLAAPLPTIALAVAAVPDGGTIALAKGTYDELVRLGRPITLRGACVGETVVAPAVEGYEAAITITNRGGVTVRDLTVQGPRFGIEVNAARAASRIESVVVDGATAVGLGVYGTDLTATDLVVRRTRADGIQGHAIEVGSGALVLDRAAIESNESIGVAVLGGEATIRDGAIRDTTPRTSDGGNGYGVLVQGGAHLTMERVSVLRNHMEGVVGLAEGTRINASDLSIEDTFASDTSLGFAFDVQRGASAALVRAWLARAGGVGLAAQEAGSEMTAEDVVVRDLSLGPTGTAHGISVIDAVLTATRTAVLGGSGGVSVAGAATFDGTDLVVADGIVSAAGEFGYGMQVHDGATVSLTRARFERRMTTAIWVGGGAHVAATDLAVRDMRERDAEDPVGYGAQVSEGSRLDLVRASFDRCNAAGLLVLDPASLLSAQDLSVTDTRPRVQDGGGGRGLEVGLGGTAEAVRSLLRANRDLGVALFGAGSSATFEDLVVEGTLERACAPTCPGSGTGIGVYEDAVLEVRAFRVSDGALCGLQLSRGGQADLHQGVVAHNPVGANVQVPDYDLARIQDDVEWIENDVPFDGTALPVPEAQPPIR